MPTSIPTLLAGLVAAALFVGYTFRKKALTLDGALTAAFIGLWVLWFAGPVWLLPLFFFFVSSTLLGKLNKNTLAAADAKQGQARDFRQVLCNGGVYAGLATWAAGPDATWATTLMALSIAGSTADTWSSEIGQYFRQKTWDILRWKPVPVGLSGGISWAGTLGGFGGAFALAMGCNFLIYPQVNFEFIRFVAIGGFAGMLLDSGLGAGLQARYQHPGNGTLSDQPGAQGHLVSGLHWMSNDAVNWWSNVLITGLGALLL